ncbi:hypothetical protein ILUMI_22417 [Ignelater luminosus]|uniref:Single domain-containing protein n=1 Tax=Ignelater luminosus TaxID=2038154 RepID=A0A8K0G2X7_IGNLU|nr:hypothetical protein ILUMI_22417 [Ignelater luminosus]
MKLLATISLVFLLISTALQQDIKEGGLTLLEWSKKCNDHFVSYPESTEKEFRLSGYCELYICEKISGQIAMRIDSCPEREVNGKKCVQQPIKSLQYPQCCRLKCFD